MQKAKESYIEEGVRVLKQGGIVIFPTDTAFGIGCRSDNEESVKRVFTVRKRPLTQATPVLVDSVDMAKSVVASLPKKVESSLLVPYWPGALTVILESKKNYFPQLVTSHGTVGLRMPNHETPLSLIRGLTLPIIGPSANFHGEKTPYVFSDINPRLYSLVDYVIPGVCDIKEVSTVIDCTVTPWKIVREGAIKIEAKRI